jgi:hypothetical protein
MPTHKKKARRTAGLVSFSLLLFLEKAGHVHSAAQGRGLQIVDCRL